jgi:hypothetical protein
LDQFVAEACRGEQASEDMFSRETDERKSNAAGNTFGNLERRGEMTRSILVATPSCENRLGRGGPALSRLITVALVVGLACGTLVSSVISARFGIGTHGPGSATVVVATEASPSASTSSPTSSVPSSAPPKMPVAEASGCPAALAYLRRYAAPGFALKCPGDANGHQAMTCDRNTVVCPGLREIVIADPCPAAYRNEASNSWVLSGLSTQRIDPYGYCPT